MGVYGNLLSHFPELYRRIDVWTQADKRDKRTVSGVYLPTKGDKLKRWKFSNRGSAVDYSDDDELYIPVKFRHKVHIGDYFYDPDAHDIHRIMGQRDFNHPGGFMVFSTERVTGATVDQHEELVVKEATFA